MLSYVNSHFLKNLLYKKYNVVVVAIQTLLLHFSSSIQKSRKEVMKLTMVKTIQSTSALNWLSSMRMLHAIVHQLFEAPPNVDIHMMCCTF